MRNIRVLQIRNPLVLFLLLPLVLVALFVLAVIMIGSVAFGKRRKVAHEPERRPAPVKIDSSGAIEAEFKKVL